MRIGIVTIYDAYNYGSFLQAFAMQEYLEKEGHEVFVLDCSSSIKNILVRKFFAKSIKRTYLKLRRFFSYREDWKLLKLRKMNESLRLDIVIIGSDEVWNIENESFEHVLQFYGINCNTQRVITYAPSLGYATKDSYESYPKLLEAIQNNISAYGVRDCFTESFLNSLGKSDIKKVCDPTILLYDRWMEYEKSYPLEYKYIVYYSYLENTPFKDYIKLFARENGLKIVTVGFNYKWCDRQLITTPREFLYIMRHAQFVVTSTFHGTVFATLLKKKFIVVHPATKVVDYLQLLSLEKICKLEYGYERFSNMLQEQVDYDDIMDRFLYLKKTSERYLAENIIL